MSNIHCPISNLPPTHLPPTTRREILTATAITITTGICKRQTSTFRHYYFPNPSVKDIKHRHASPSRPTSYLLPIHASWKWFHGRAHVFITSRHIQPCDGLSPGISPLRSVRFGFWRLCCPVSSRGGFSGTCTCTRTVQLSQASPSQPSPPQSPKKKEHFHHV